MPDETANPPEPGPASAELERLQAEDTAIGWEIQTLLAEGRQMRENGATDADPADINAELNDLYRRRPAPSRLRQLELDKENEKHGWTRLADGSYGKTQANGTVLSGYCGLVEFTDSDGTVYRETPDDQRRRAEEHRTVALAFHARVTDERLRRTPRARVKCLAPASRRMPQARSPRPSARRAAGARSGQDPGEDGLEDSSEPPKRRLCTFCGGDIPADRAPQATYCSERHAARDRQRRKRHRDRERDVRPPTPQPADFWRMHEITDEDRARLRALVECRCNGRHQEFEPGECFRCGHWLPRGVLA